MNVDIAESVTLDQSRLNIADKQRSSRLPWRGQFSPELIEYFLESFANTHATVLDPFCGSGTVLFECLEKGYPSFGADVSPAAFLLASASSLAPISLSKRSELLQSARQAAYSVYQTNLPGGLFTDERSPDSGETDTEATRRLIQATGHNVYLHEIVALALMLGMGSGTAQNLAVFEKGLAQVDILLKGLPVSTVECKAVLGDARHLPLPSEAIDLVITSPPYINVFNYHQNYRPVLELLGWSPLKSAPSEIGANRKHRQNRFLTVVQYCIDMQLAFTEIARVLRPGGRIILVVGRSSLVLGTSFYNGDLLEAVLRDGTPFSLLPRSHRFFVNRFGERIYEEIIIATRSTEAAHDLALGKSVGIAALRTSLATASEDAKPVILEAIGQADSVMPSPKLDISVPVRVAYLDAQEPGRINVSSGGKEKSSVEVVKSTAHGDKLKALLVNGKVPEGDLPRVKEAVDKYNLWIAALNSVTGQNPADILAELVRLLANYKRFIELELIYDSSNDFLYRQKGQLKLDNTILEEFLPYLFDQRLIPGFGRLRNITCGPRSSFAGLTFDSPFMALCSGGAYVKLKDQDFSVNKKHRISITEDPPTEDIFTANVSVSYFATEIKTNLDKTMFQEATQTAGELKRAVSGCKYILLCEYLDMTPINTKLTPIDEVIVLRKAKRLASNIRDQFSTARGRQGYRERYVEYLDRFPLRKECFGRFIDHLNECFPTAIEDEEDIVLGRGYF